MLLWSTAQELSLELFPLHRTRAPSWPYAAQPNNPGRRSCSRSKLSPPSRRCRKQMLRLGFACPSLLLKKVCCNVGFVPSRWPSRVSQTSIHVCPRRHSSECTACNAARFQGCNCYQLHWNGVLSHFSVSPSHQSGLFDDPLSDVKGLWHVKQPLIQTRAPLWVAERVWIDLFRWHWVVRIICKYNGLHRFVMNIFLDQINVYWSWLVHSHH